MDSTNTPIQDRVRELRQARGLLQQGLADKAKVSRQTVVNLENGRHVPETATLLKLATALGVSLGDLLG